MAQPNSIASKKKASGAQPQEQETKAMPFFNPYHFVPVLPDDRTDQLTPESLANDNSGNVTHKCHVPKTHSGRIICTVTTESPFFIGGERHPPENGKASVADGFELDGKPAIPASSLRGLISSTAEAASNSAMRVLTDRALSFRRTMKDGLSALALIVQNPQNPAQHWLVPLAAPTLQINDGQVAEDTRFHKAFPKGVPLKVYIGNNNNLDNPVAFPYRTAVLQNGAMSPLHYMKIAAAHVPWQGNGKFNSAGMHLHLSGNGSLVLGQCPLPGAPDLPISEAQWQQLLPGDRAAYKPGIVRVLGRSGRQIPPNKKYHELFIPYSPTEPRVRLVIPPAVVDRFYELADERTQSTREGEQALPYEPRGTARSEPPDGKRRFRLKTGDIVYFGMSNNEISEIALSSIWRGSATDKLFSFFNSLGPAPNGDPNLVPYSPGRTRITIAEQMFGFVEDRPRNSGIVAPALALASRIRFSDGLMMPLPDGKSPRLPAVTLKTLGQPKPPCPSMYFRKRKTPFEYIPKNTLNQAAHIPQGRKMYLHFRQTQIDNACWETHDLDSKSARLKTRVEPLRDGLTFYFHLDFNNLSDKELAILLYSLRPTPQFRHKIGMGKSIGLGQIRIDPVGVFLVDRLTRYSKPDDFFCPRYHKVWRPTNLPSEVSDRYIREAAADPNLSLADVEGMRSHFMPALAIRRSLELIGDPASVDKYDVHTPTSTTQIDPERETFLWFMENEAPHNRQHLQPITENEKTLPCLKETSPLPKKSNS